MVLGAGRLPRKLREMNVAYGQIFQEVSGKVVLPVRQLCYLCSPGLKLTPLASPICTKCVDREL